MEWSDWGDRWPLADHSRFVRIGGHHWHIQSLGTGPEVLFLHGAGASTHSFRDMLPALADRFTCHAIDLPGQGFTRVASSREHSLRHMARAVKRLIAEQGWGLSAIVGHSAGAAVAFRLALDADPQMPVVSLNGSLRNFEGVAGWLYPLMAKTLVLNPVVPAAFARY